MPLSAPPPTTAQGAPIKIGFLAPMSGAFAQVGKDMLNGTELYLDEIGRQVGGRKIELIVEDDEGTPATALNKSRKLVEQDKVHLLTGGQLANVGYALQPFIDGNGIPATYPVIAADDITQRKPAKWIVRTGWSTSQPMHPFAEWTIKNTKYRKVAAVGHGLRLRLRDHRRLPARVRGAGRADRAEDLGAAEHQRLRAVRGPDPARRRRGAGAVHRPAGAAVREAVPGGGAPGQAAAS